MTKSERFLVGTKYRPELLKGKYDAIVIGSGIGGLTTAALLSQAGKRVLVLERHYMAGGFTHAYKRKGYEWDVGVHYIGGVQNHRSTLRRLFDHISEGRLEWARITENAYDRITIAGESYDYVSGLEPFRQQMLEYFPNENRAIEQYLQLVFEVERSSRSFFMNKALPPLFSAMTHPFMSRRFQGLADRTTREVISKLSDDKRLLGVLTGQWGDYGLPPGQSSFAIHAMIVRHYLDGANYPVGGASSIARSIEPTITAQGGDILTSAEVEKVLVHKDRAVGVRLTDGVEIEATDVISGIGIFNTVEKLLETHDAERMGYCDKMKNVERSPSHICLYIGLRESAQSLGLRQTNLWIYPGYDHDANLRRYKNDPDADLPLTYISFPSSKDPDWERRYPGRSTIEVISFSPYEWFSKWKNTPWRKRGDEYLALKNRMSERMLNVLYSAVPQVEGKIDFYELSTALSTRHFTGYERGEIYGLSHTPSRFRQKWLRPRTPLKHLFLTGQDIVTNGVAGALFSGVLTASAILKHNVLKKN